MSVWGACVGPQLYAAGGSPYEAGALEAWGSRVLVCVRACVRVCVWGSPLVCALAWRREPPLLAQAAAAVRPAALLVALAAAAFCARGCGRYADPRYRDFLRALTAPGDRTRLDRFDFEFGARPLDFDCAELGRAASTSESGSAPIRSVRALLAEIAVRTFGLALIYPGSTALLRLLIGRALLEGRLKLVEEHRGRRRKIKTADGNFVDCMFFDKSADSERGKTLVITSEGNAGFYEIGIVSTPLEAGHSVLGWNRPGFGESTGRPFPSQERHAIDAVFRYATEKLDFAPENVVLYGWSIGCYSIAWAAVRYPSVRGVIMDATFDDLLPLALSRMPPFLEPLVVEIVKGRVDLNVSEILTGYSGPLKFVRRTFDEIICVDVGNPSSNRGNDLLIDQLRSRHPDATAGSALDLARAYLSDEMNPRRRASLLDSFPGSAAANERTLALVDEYIVDYRSTHCTPLPVEYFSIPKKR